jgi:hypothetical protein
MVSSKGKRAVRAAAVGLVAMTPVLALPLACITAPPADPPEAAVQGPTIISAMPAVDGYLTVLPSDGMFVVSVNSGTSAMFSWSATYNYFPGNPNRGDPLGYIASSTAGVDGGIALVSFPVPTEFDPTQCAVITFEVASTELRPSLRVPQSGTASTIEWHYTPGGPGNCDTFDAGDGAFPPDAPSDVLIVPDVVNPI